jgi:hypothetical protein
VCDLFSPEFRGNSRSARALSGRRLLNGDGTVKVLSMKVFVILLQNWLTCILLLPKNIANVLSN